MTDNKNNNNNKTVQVSSLLSLQAQAKSLQYENYRIIDCSPVTGILYLVNNFLSGHVRVRGRNNGQYPYNYKEMIDNIFGAANNAVEVCSNSIKGDKTLTTVDIRPDTNPDHVILKFSG